MKMLTRSFGQVRRYGPSEGFIVIELHDNETIDDVIKEYVKDRYEWHEVKYTNPRELDSYVQEDGSIVKGRFVKLDMFREYLD